MRIVIPVKTEIQDTEEEDWFPACAGMTDKGMKMGKVDFKSISLETNWESGMGKKKDLIKALDWDERPVTDSEGMRRDEISLGSVENGLYLGREKKRMLLLQKT